MMLQNMFPVDSTRNSRNRGFLNTERFAQSELGFASGKSTAYLADIFCRKDRTALRFSAWRVTSALGLAIGVVITVGAEKEVRRIITRGEIARMKNKLMQWVNAIMKKIREAMTFEYATTYTKGAIAGVFKTQPRPAVI